MGPMIGYAVTVVCEPGNPDHRKNASAPEKCREYIASIPGPKIVVVQDLDKPATLGSYWGEVSASLSRALGCVGTITDGAIRDVDEMASAGFKALARRLCVGHAHSWPVRWGCEVEVFGRKINHGDLIHADKHGFLVIPEEDQAGLLEAAIFMDRNECDTMISTARGATGKLIEKTLADLNEASRSFREAVREKFGQKGEL
jgi:regulator of RNase E activity RraA